jgi:hypothetical protein
MGPGYSGLFNANSPGAPELFHFQFFGVPIPLWTELDRGRVTVSGRSSRLGEASRGSLKAWPIEAPVFESDNPDDLAASVWAYDQQVRADGRYVTDLLFNHASDGGLRVVALRRRRDRSRPQSFYPEDPSAYGDFGGLELAGLIVTIAKVEMFRAFAGDRGLAATRFEAALREVTES